MKKIKKNLLLLILLLFFATGGTVAQPLPVEQHDSENDQQAPIGSGIVILIALGTAYGVVKLKQRNVPKTE